MGSTMNALAAHRGTVPFGATFLVFSDYMRPPIRLAALMGLHVIYGFTHDSIAAGRGRFNASAGRVVSVERFGASAPVEVLLREYGFSVDSVCARAKTLLAR
jgi:transketolase